MIFAVVNYKPDGAKSVDYITERFKGSTPMFENMPGLVCKYFGFDEAEHAGTSVYIWESREAAEKCYGNPAFLNSFKESFGADCVPDIKYVEIKHIVDNK